MKKLIFLLLLPLSVFSQERGVTQIIIKNNSSARDNFNVAVKSLLDSGYSIESKDNEFLTIKTQPKSIAKIGSYFLNIRAMENQIVMSGMTKSGMVLSIYGVSSTDEYIPIQNKSKGSFLMKSFTEMQKFAGAFKSELTYK